MCFFSRMTVPATVTRTYKIYKNAGAVERKGNAGVVEGKGNAEVM